MPQYILCTKKIDIPNFNFHDCRLTRAEKKRKMLKCNMQPKFESPNIIEKTLKKNPNYHPEN